MEVRNMEFMDLFLSILAGIISGVTILPIASDAIRSKLFGRRKKAISDAKKELLETIQGMLLSGQIITQPMFKILAENASQKHGISVSALGDKDNIIGEIIQVVNSSKVVPNNMKKQISSHLQAQLGDGSNNDDGPKVDFDIENNLTKDIVFEWREKNETQEQGESATSTGLEKMIVFYIVLLVAAVVTFSFYKLKSYSLFPVILCIAAFLICINMLTSLMGNSEPKNLDFFRRLVYKIISIIVLIVFIMVLIIFLK